MTATPVFVVAERDRVARIETVLRRDRELHVSVLDPSALTTLDGVRATPIVVVALPSADATRIVEALRRAAEPPAIVLLTSTPHEAWSARARRGGIRAVLPSEPSAEELLAAVAAAKAGLLALHPAALSRRASAPPLPSGEPTALTARELEILEMLAEGMSNRAIAGRLKISRHTVKFHVAAILAKLAARSRTEAVTLGVRQGLLSL